MAYFNLSQIIFESSFVNSNGTGCYCSEPPLALIYGNFAVCHQAGKLFKI